MKLSTGPNTESSVRMSRSLRDVTSRAPGVIDQALAGGGGHVDFNDARCQMIERFVNDDGAISSNGGFDVAFADTQPLGEILTSLFDCLFFAQSHVTVIPFLGPLIL